MHLHSDTSRAVGFASILIRRRRALIFSFSFGERLRLATDADSIDAKQEPLANRIYFNRLSTFFHTSLGRSVSFFQRRLEPGEIDAGQ